MLLRNFIKNTILEIIEGVKLSQDEIPKIYNKVQVNPPYPYKNATVRKNDAPDTSELTKVKFDIAIGTKESKEKGISGGIEVISGGINKSNENTVHNKVQFDLNIFIPSDFSSND